MDRSAQAGTALIVGGLVAVVTFFPFTNAHGPTSFNIEREVLGWDMHRWGSVMGTVPQVLVGLGVWRLRDQLAGGRRIASRALTVMCVAMFLFAAMNLVMRAIGPPLDLFLVAPAGIVAATTTAARGVTRGLLVALAGSYAASLVLALVPLETSDSFGGYRIFGLIAYAGGGALWAALGAVLLRHPEPAAPLATAR